MALLWRIQIHLISIPRYVWFEIKSRIQWAFGFREISVWLNFWLVKDCIQLLLDTCRVLTKNIFSSRLKSTVMTGSIGFFLTWASFRFITWMMAFLARLRARGRSQFTLTRIFSLLTTCPTPVYICDKKILPSKRKICIPLTFPVQPIPVWILTSMGYLAP